MNLWLHVPHNDTYAEHVGEAAVCEVWRSAYVYRARQAARYDSGHGCFTAVFPSDFEEPPDPWLLNPTPPGGRRDGEYTVVWRLEPDGEAVAHTWFRFKNGRYELFNADREPASTDWKCGWGRSIS